MYRNSYAMYRNSSQCIATLHNVSQLFIMYMLFLFVLCFYFQSKAAYVLFYTRRDDPDNEMMNTSELLTEDTDVFHDDDETMIS